MFNRNSSSSAAEVEFYQLVREVSKFHFSTSSEVSRYIRENKLGYKYSHISGCLEMENGKDSWNFDGGIAPLYYKRLCRALHLGCNGSSASVRSFTSYADQQWA